MRFATRIVEDVTVVSGQGRLDMLSGPELRELTAHSITAGRNRVVVDLSGVEFMDSSGLGALIGSLKATREAGGDLRIATPTAQVSMVLELSNVIRILPPYPSADSAFDE